MYITNEKELRSLYGQPTERAVAKEIPAVDGHAAQFIRLSPFVVLASCNASGDMDASPRGGEPGFVKVLDSQTVLIPDAPGNNRLDTLSNIVATGRLGLIFLVPGFDETLRINGRAMLSTDPVDLQRCADDRRTPKLVIKVTVDSLYLHCGKALMRSHLWDSSRQAKRSQMPSLGEIVRDQVQVFKGQTLDAPTQDEMLKRYRETL